MKGQIQAFIYFLSQGNPKVLAIFLISAVFVTVARILGPIEIYWDQGIQLEAAHRLVQGLGLTIASESALNPNINEAPEPLYLTHFPPGFSLIVACLLFSKLSLATSLKIIYSLTTIIGWLGWAIIGCHFLSKELRFGSISFPAQFIIAAILPIFYTPSWYDQGTDIFLWSGVPFIVIFLLYSSIERLRNVFLVLAGLIWGILVSFRYASLFLAATAFLILFQVNFPKIKLFLRQYFTFLLSSLFIIAPLLIYIKLVATNTAFHHTEFTSPLTFFGVTKKILGSFSNTLVLFGDTSTPLFSKIYYVIDNNQVINYSLDAICFFIIALLPLIVFKLKRLDIDTFRNNLSISLSFLPISLVFFLATTSVNVHFNPLRISRYYLPINLCLIFIIYEIGTLANIYITRSHIARIIRLISSALIVLFLASNILLRPTYLFFKSNYYAFTVKPILGISKLPNNEYPSNQVFPGKSLQDSTLEVKRLRKENPKALFFIDYYPFYTYSNSNSPNLRAIPDRQFWEQAYLSEAAKIFWVINQQSCTGICSSPHISKPTPIESLSSLPNLKTVYIDPDNQTKIMVSDLPKGYKFSDGYQKNRE